MRAARLTTSAPKLHTVPQEDQTNKAGRPAAICSRQSNGFVVRRSSPAPETTAPGALFAAGTSPILSRSGASSQKGSVDRVAPRSAAVATRNAQPLRRIGARPGGGTDREVDLL